MKSIEELRDDLTHQVKSAEDIQSRADKANRALTAEEQKFVGEYLATADGLKNEIKTLEDQAKLRDRIQAELDGLAQPNIRTTKASDPNGGNAPVIATPGLRVNGYQKRWGKLQAFKNEEHAYRSGQWLLASYFGNGKAKRFCEQNGINFQGAMSEGTNTAGGNLVPDEMSQAIIDLRETYGVFRANARVRPMSSDTLTIPRIAGHVTAGFTNEATAISNSDMTIDTVTLVAKKLGCLTYFSTELEEDAVVSVVDQLARDMAWAFALKEDQCGFAGDGSATYGGIRGLNFYFTAASRAGAVDADSNHDTFAEIDEDDLSRVMGKCPAYALPRAKWYCSSVANEMVFGRIKAMSGGNNVQTLNGAFGNNYAGYPIVIAQTCPTSTGDLSDVAMLYFGDLEAAASLGERRGVQVRRSDEIKFVEDQVALKATERIDIVCHDLGDATNAGPIVALIGE